jgi:RNA polymerase sigma-70 factor (ECF subfamily)
MYARIETPEELELLGDAELVRLFKRGHDDALEILLRRHSDALYRFCCHLMTNREDAEDICQETMARAITRVDSLQAGAAFRSWLFSVARNLSVDSYRSKKRTCPMPDEEAMPLPLYGDTPQDRIEISEEHQTVAEALGKLAQSHQRVLVLREVDGLSYADIASEMNVSQSAVETLLFRARRRLKEEYSKTAVPVITFLGGLQDLAARLVGGPAMTKVAVTAAVVGGTVLTAPHVEPVYHEQPKPQSLHQSPRAAQSVQAATQGPARPVAASAPNYRPVTASFTAPAAAHANAPVSHTAPSSARPLRAAPAQAPVLPRTAPAAPPAVVSRPASSSLAPKVAVQQPVQGMTVQPTAATAPKAAPRTGTGVFRPSAPASAPATAAGTQPMVASRPAAQTAGNTGSFAPQAQARVTAAPAGAYPVSPAAPSAPVAPYGAGTPQAPSPAAPTTAAPATGGTTSGRLASATTARGKAGKH